MSRTVAGLSLLLLVAGASWLAVALIGAPEPVPASAPPEVFSAERALEHVRALAGAPRPLGTAAHDRARDYVLERLRGLGLETQVQRATGRSTIGRAFGTVENVVARLPGGSGGGDAGRRAVLLVAHYDSVAAGPGASDDAVGVAVVLETLRALRAGVPPGRDVIALVSDGEEGGLLGADAFVHAHPWAGDVAVVLNFEARGTRGPALMFETGAGNRALVEVFAEAAPYPAAASYSYEVYRRLPNDTDFSVFRRAGHSGLNFAHIHGAVGYHTAMDSVDRLDPGSLQHHGSNALSLTRALADAGSLPGPASGEGAAEDAVYFNPLGWSFVWFPAGWVPVLAALLALGALAVLVLALVRRRLGAGGLAAGLGAWVLTVAVVGALALAARGLVFPSSYDFRVWGDGSSVAWALFGAALAVLGLVALLHRVARRFVAPASLAAGGLLLWTAVAVPVSLVAPGASYLFLVPLAGQLPAAVYLLARGPGRRPAEGEAGEREDERFGPISWGLLALGGVVAALVWAPALAMVAVGLQAGALVVLAALGGLLLALLSPQLEEATSGFLGLAVPAALVVAGVALVVAVRLASGFGPDDPRPSSLVYALDADSGEARWVTFDREPGPWTRTVLPEAPERWSLQRFNGWDRELAAGPAPALDYPAPVAERVAEAGAAGEAGRHRMRVIPPPGAHRLRLFLGPAAEVRSVIVEDREAELPQDAGEEPLHLLYWNPPSEGVNLTVELERSGPLELAAVAQWFGLPAEDQGGPPERPEGLMQASWPWDADTVMVRKDLPLAGPAAEPVGSPVE